MSPSEIIPGKRKFLLSNSSALLQNIMANTTLGIALVDLDGRLIEANVTYYAMFGCAASECVGSKVADLAASPQAPDDQQATSPEGQSSDVRRRCTRKDGSVFWARVIASTVRNERSGEPICSVLQVEDIDQQRATEEAVAENESRWNFALEGAGQGVWDLDAKRGRVFYSRRWREMRGFGLDEEIDGSREAWLSRVHPDDRQRLLEQSVKQQAGEIAPNDFEYRERHRDGQWIWILSRGRPIEWMPDGSVARIIGTDTDITAMKAAEARAATEANEVFKAHFAALEKAHETAEAARQMAQSLARHDALTGLPNRRVFAEAMDAAVVRANRSAGVNAIVMIDLDRFKPVNDIHGHAVGDDVLREITLRLRDAVRKGDTLARLGGDEFGVIVDCLPGEKPGDAAIRLAERIVELIQRPIVVGDRHIELGASIGIAICPEDGLDSETLLRAADMAMYRAKEEGRGTFCFFQPSMEADLRARVALEDDIRQAVATEQIQPYYQPLIRLTENRIVGFEILARWYHPMRGNVAPATFIPVVENLGLISELTYSLLRRACIDARDWPPEISIALNVSPKHLIDPLLPVKVLAILSETGFSPNRLEIEITETALMSDIANARAVLGALRAIGIKISLDDFGTGYSSLSHLRELHFDKIKIDRSFVLAMDKHVESAKIVHSVIALAKSLGLPTIAEGIEDPETMKQIVDGGAEYGQGFYFGKAMPAAEANKLVRDAAGDRGARRKA